MGETTSIFNCVSLGASLRMLNGQLATAEAKSMREVTRHTMRKVEASRRDTIPLKTAIKHIRALLTALLVRHQMMSAKPAIGHGHGHLLPEASLRGDSLHTTGEKSAEHAKKRVEDEESACNPQAPHDF